MIANSQRTRRDASRAPGAAPAHVALRALFDNSPDGMLLVDRRDRIVEANIRASRLLRVPRTGLIGKRFADVATVERARREPRVAGTAGAVDAAPVFLAIRREDRTTLDVVVYDVRRVVPGMRVLVLRVAIAPQPLVEELEGTARLLEEAERVGRMGAWRVDLQAGVVVRTPGLCRIIEVPSTARTTSIEESYETYAEASRLIAREAFTATMTRGTPYDLEFEVVTGRGNRFWAREVCTARMRRGRVASIIGVLQDISERRRLAHLLTHTAGEERARIGADLHDGLGQELTGLALMLRSAATRLEKDNRGLSTELGELATLASKAVQTARSVAHGVLPVDLGADGLAGALRRLSRATTAAVGVRIAVRFSGEERFRPNSTVAENLYRIAQEAITNAVKHARPKRVSIAVRASETQTVLVVSNDGERIDLDRLGEGMGLQIMRHRARMLGGRVDVQSVRRGGTRVRCVVPRSEVA